MKLSHRKEVDGKAVVWCCGGYIEFRLAENMMDPRIRAKAIEKYHPRSVVGSAAGSFSSTAWAALTLFTESPAVKTGEDTDRVSSP